MIGRVGVIIFTFYPTVIKKKVTLPETGREEEDEAEALV